MKWRIMNVLCTASSRTKCFGGSNLTTLVLDAVNTDFEYMHNISKQCVTHYNSSISLGNFDKEHQHNKYREVISPYHSYRTHLRTLLSIL
jgi:hypothetical protein